LTNDNGNGFIDYYELMQLSPSADTDTIERIFRHLAIKYHPDNIDSGDAEKFRQLVDAYRLLSEPEKRAGYDIKYREYWNTKWNIASEAASDNAFAEDRIHRDSILSILYIQRRREVQRPGVGTYELARLITVPPELVDFHVWYLKEKGWVVRTESGQLAITVLGAEHVEQSRIRLGKDHMLTTGYDSPGDDENTRSGDLPLPPPSHDLNP